MTAEEALLRWVACQVRFQLFSVAYPLAHFGVKLLALVLKPNVVAVARFLRGREFVAGKPLPGWIGVTGCRPASSSLL